MSYFVRIWKPAFELAEGRDVICPPPRGAEEVVPDVEPLLPVAAPCDFAECTFV